MPKESHLIDLPLTSLVFLRIVYLVEAVNRAGVYCDAAARDVTSSEATITAYAQAVVATKICEHRYDRADDRRDARDRGDRICLE